MDTDYTTCTVMCGSGVKIAGTSHTMKQEGRMMEGHGKIWQVITECPVAVVWGLAPSIVAQHTAKSSIQLSLGFLSDFAS